MTELIILLLIFMIVGAIIALETKDLLSSIISIGAVGFGLAIAFLFLGAPDIAITQVVVEVLVLVILIRATISRDLTSITSGREFFSTTANIVLVFIVFIFGLQIFRGLPSFGDPVINYLSESPSLEYIRTGSQKTGATNLVTAILLDWRGYDTLGEATVLFTAILGALALLRLRSRKSKQEIKDE